MNSSAALHTDQVDPNNNPLLFAWLAAELAGCQTSDTELESMPDPTVHAFNFVLDFDLDVASTLRIEHRQDEGLFIVSATSKKSQINPSILVFALRSNHLMPIGQRCSLDPLADDALVVTQTLLVQGLTLDVLAEAITDVSEFIQICMDPMVHSTGELQDAALSLNAQVLA